MRNYPVFDTASQNEALINEFKGNLFEYLVGASLARHGGFEADFLKSMDQELSQRLRSYEDWLWENDITLARQLPLLAHETAQKLLSHIDSDFQRVVVMGKLAGGSHDQSFGEADLLVIDQSEKVRPISLKLCRKGAYVNTKSAGIRSFLSKYFSQIDNVSLLQERLNLVLDESFGEFAQALHQRHDLDGSNEFGVSWKAAGLPVLPGELNSHDQQLLQQHYWRMIQLIYESLNHAFLNQRSDFNLAMASLLGLNVNGMIQLTCFHHGSGEKAYQLDHLDVVLEQERLQELALAQMTAPIAGQASFSIVYPWGDLQIRVKPMNKFTQAALKVNCSVRHR